MNYRPIIAILILFCGVNSVALSAGQNAILVCLGQEELRIHRERKEGPEYLLNQHFINEFSSYNNVQIKSDYMENICNSKEFSPSVNLLRQLLINGKEVIDMSITSRNASLNSYRKSTVKNLLDRIPHIFFKYLMGIQSFAPTPDCLPRYIPELGYFLERYQYFESDYPVSALMQEKDKIRNIFKKLKNINPIIKKCRVDYKKRRALRGLK